MQFNREEMKVYVKKNRGRTHEEDVLRLAVHGGVGRDDAGFRVQAELEPVFVRVRHTRHEVVPHLAVDAVVAVARLNLSHPRTTWHVLKTSVRKR